MCARTGISCLRIARHLGTGLALRAACVPQGSGRDRNVLRMQTQLVKVLGVHVHHSLSLIVYGDLDRQLAHPVRMA